MKVKLLTLIQAQNSIATLGTLPFKLSWRIQKIARKINSAVEDYSKDEFAAIKEYGKEKEPIGCGEWEPLPENKTALGEALKDMQSKEVEIDFDPIHLTMLDFAPDPKFPEDKFRIPPFVLLNLDWMFTDEEKQEPPK